MKSVDRALSEVAAPVRELHEELVAKRDALQVKLDGVRADLVQVTRALKAVDPEFAAETAPKPQPKAGKPKGFTPSDELLAKVFEAVQDGAETNKEISEMAGVSTASVSAAVAVLRERQMIRKAGRRQDAPGKPNIFKPLQLREKVNS